MSRAFTSKPCPGCGITSNLAPNTVCRGCQEAIRDHKRLKAASEALEQADYYSLHQGIAPLQAYGLASCVDFETAFVDLLRALCATRPEREAGYTSRMDESYHNVHRGEGLAEPLAFLATGCHDSTGGGSPGLQAAIHRLFGAVDALVIQAHAQRTRATAIDRRIQEEVWVANDLIAQTGCTRDEALRVAARVVGQDPQFR